MRDEVRNWRGTTRVFDTGSLATIRYSTFRSGLNFVKIYYKLLEVKFYTRSFRRSNNPVQDRVSFM